MASSFLSLGLGTLFTETIQKLKVYTVWSYVALPKEGNENGGMVQEP
jgi:hypothetical protein